MPSTRSVSNVALDEIRKEQMKFNKEVLETLQLIRQEIKDNQEKTRVELEKMKEEQKKVMDEVKEDQKKMHKEQEKVLKEVEAIRNEMKKDSEEEVPENTTIENEDVVFKVIFWGKQKRFIIQCLPTDTILDLKKEIEKEGKVPVLRQSIFFNHRKCEDYETISECGIEEGSAVDLYRK